MGGMGWIPAFAGMTEPSCQVVARIIPAHVISKEGLGQRSRNRHSEYLPQRRQDRKGDGPKRNIPSEGEGSKEDFSRWSK
jgi:hypothetical protein